MPLYGRRNLYMVSSAPMCCAALRQKQNQTDGFDRQCVLIATGSSHFASSLFTSWSQSVAFLFSSVPVRHMAPEAAAALQNVFTFFVTTCFLFCPAGVCKSGLVPRFRRGRGREVHTQNIGVVVDESQIAPTSSWFLRSGICGFCPRPFPTEAMWQRPAIFL